MKPRIFHARLPLATRPSQYSIRSYVAKSRLRSLPPTEQPQSGLSEPALGRRSRVPLYLGGALIYGVSIYIGSVLYHIYSTAPLQDTAAGTENVTSLMSSKPEIYDRIADHYDSDINLDEVLMGLTWLRWWLFRRVSGDVLEVSAGTGRNLKYMDPTQMDSLTLVDQSSEMLQQAESKLQTLRRSDTRWASTKVTVKDVPVEGLSPNRDQFDVIIQSFGLCSVSDPSAYLDHLSTFCRGPTGRIILLEHGRSKYAWINRLLDATVVGHAERWGCFYNRDIESIVEGCNAVEVVAKQRWHLGTTYCYTLRPKQ